MTESVYSGRKAYNQSIKSVSLVSLRRLILFNCRRKSTLLMGKKVEINIGSNVEMEDRANKVKQFI